MKHNITLKNCIRKEPVLCTAALLAALSALVVLPDPAYAGYIDFRTLAILFSLMTVMAGLRGQGVFSRMGQALLGRAGGVFPLVLVLVGLCFFGSMLITNDVALLTFVPFTFAVLGRLEPTLCRALAVPVVCMQTVAANLGSMLTPIGNPQNLYLYGKSNMPLVQFVRLMLPYSLLSLGLLLVWAFGVCRTLSLGAAPRTLSTGNTPIESPRLVGMYAVLFCVCLGTVARLVPCGVSFAAVLLCTFLADRKALRRVDYSLLCTFAAFFIFIGNLGRVPAFSAWLQGMIAGREVPVAVLASQLTSNVPAALLLSGFTQNTAALIIGTNLGGLGTLIASMASLISYRQIAQELPQQKGRYFALFTLSNLVFLAILMAAWLIFG